MALQAVIGPRKLKSFTKTLSCLSRYGDDVVIKAKPDALVLSATNSSKSAFFRVQLASEYFDKYNLKTTTQPGMTFKTPTDVDKDEGVTGQLLVKSLLSILKHKTVEKTVDRCDLSIVEGGGEPDPSADAEDEDSLATKLVIRLHCKHGVVKTHRLLLLTQTSPFAPQITSSLSQSRVTVGPHALKAILDHFPNSKGSKMDPQLVWLFAINDVTIKSMELCGDVRGKSQISTEITMSADEFDSYTICDPPVTLAFHLREFNATIALAESLSVALKLRFTEPASPIFIQFDTDMSDSEYLFIISTTQIDLESPSRSSATNLRKRNREYDVDNESAPKMAKKPLRAAVPASTATASPATSRRSSAADIAPADVYSLSNVPARRQNPEPLFMPGASQLSVAEMDVLRESGLATDHMDYEEFEAMMEAEGEEVGMSTAIHHSHGGQAAVEPEWDEDRTDPDDQQLGPSQGPPTREGKASISTTV